VVQAPDKVTLPCSARDGRVQRRIQDHLRLLERIQLTKVPEKLKESDVPWQVQLADAAKHSEVGLQQGEQALRAILVDVPTRVFLLRMVDKIMHILAESV